MKTVAIFGGTFNPIHKGHIEIIDALCNIDDIEKVLVIPTKIPPHKNSDFLAGEQDRLNMCQIACKKFSKVSVSNIEFLREGKSYTVDTVADIANLYPKHKIAVTIGADMVTTFTEWKDYKKLLDRVELIVFYRAGIDIEKFNLSIKMLEKEGAKIRYIDKTITDTSSSDIRCYGQNAETMANITLEIFKYISENNLYGINNG